jgi:hypothetical protein
MILGVARILNHAMGKAAAYKAIPALTINTSLFKKIIIKWKDASPIAAHN